MRGLRSLLVFMGVSWSCLPITGRDRAAADPATGVRFDPVPARRVLDADAASALEPEECLALLAAWEIPFERVDGAPGSIRTPIRLTGPVRGVTFRIPWAVRNGHDVLDCRLGVALAQWASMLAERGIVEVRLFSFYRQGARRGVSDPAGAGRLSQHHFGLAVDAGWFITAAGDVLDVKEHFATTDGGPVCDGEADDDRAAVLLAVFCDAVRVRLFHVQLSPLHDAHHRNHFHLDLGGGNGGWFVE